MPVILDEERHEYWDGAVQLPGVTHIVRFLSREKQDAAPILQREAAKDRGKRAHEYCQLLDYDCLPDFVDADCAPYIEGYKRFLRDYRVTSWLYSELVVGSAEAGYAGTIDRAGIIDGKLTIVDLKCTATTDKKSTAAQLCGYAKLYAAHFGEHPAELWAVRLNKDGTYTPFKDGWRGINAFEWCFNLHNYLKEEWK